MRHLIFEWIKFMAKEQISLIYKWLLSHSVSHTHTKQNIISWYYNLYDIVQVTNGCALLFLLLNGNLAALIGGAILGKACQIFIINSYVDSLQLDV